MEPKTKMGRERKSRMRALYPGLMETWDETGCHVDYDTVPDVEDCAGLGQFSDVLFPDKHSFRGKTGRGQWRWNEGD